MYKRARLGLIAAAIVSPLIAVPLLTQEAAHAFNHSIAKQKTGKSIAARRTRPLGPRDVTSFYEVVRELQAGPVGTAGQVRATGPVTEDAAQPDAGIRHSVLQHWPEHTAQFGHSGNLILTHEPNGDVSYRDALTGRIVLGDPGMATHFVPEPTATRRARTLTPREVTGYQEVVTELLAGGVGARGQVRTTGPVTEEAAQPDAGIRQRVLQQFVPATAQFGHSGNLTVTREPDGRITFRDALTGRVVLGDLGTPTHFLPEPTQ